MNDVTVEPEAPMWTEPTTTPTYREALAALLALYGATAASSTQPIPFHANRQAHDALDTVRRYFDAHTDPTAGLPETGRAQVLRSALTNRRSRSAVDT